MSGAGVGYVGQRPVDAFRSAGGESRTRRKRSSKTRPFSLRFTDEERAYLNKRAGALSLAAYIRLKLFSECETPPTRRKPSRKRYSPSAELAVLGHMLGGLGRSELASSLSGIAEAARIGALPVTPELEQELHEACLAVQDMRRELISALGVKVQ